MAYARAQIIETKRDSLKFVRYRDGEKLYGMGLSKFQQIAKEAKATYKIDKVVLVNTAILDRYIETFREF